MTKTTLVLLLTLLASPDAKASKEVAFKPPPVPGTPIVVCSTTGFYPINPKGTKE